MGDIGAAPKSQRIAPLNTSGAHSGGSFLGRRTTPGHGFAGRSKIAVAQGLGNDGGRPFVPSASLLVDSQATGSVMSV